MASTLKTGEQNCHQKFLEKWKSLKFWKIGVVQRRESEKTTFVQDPTEISKMAEGSASPEFQNRGA